MLVLVLLVLVLVYFDETFSTRSSLVLLFILFILVEVEVAFIDKYYLGKRGEAPDDTYRLAEISFSNWRDFAAASASISSEIPAKRATFNP